MLEDYSHSKQMQGKEIKSNNKTFEDYGKKSISDNIDWF